MNAATKKRCPNGSRKNKLGVCVPTGSIVKRKRCPNGSRKNKHGDCIKKGIVPTTTHKSDDISHDASDDKTTKQDDMAFAHALAAAETAEFEAAKKAAALRAAQLQEIAMKEKAEKENQEIRAAAIIAAQKAAATRAAHIAAEKEAIAKKAAKTAEEKKQAMLKQASELSAKELAAKNAETEKALRDAAAKIEAAKKAAEAEAVVVAKSEKTEIGLAFDEYTVADNDFRKALAELNEAKEMGNVHVTLRRAQHLVNVTKAKEKKQRKWYNLYPWDAKPTFVSKANLEMYNNIKHITDELHSAIEAVYPVIKQQEEDNAKLAVFIKSTYKARYNENLTRAIVALHAHGGFKVDEHLMPAKTFNTPIKLYLYRQAQPSLISVGENGGVKALKHYRAFQEIWQTFTPAQISNVSNALMCAAAWQDDDERRELYRRHCLNNVNKRVYEIGQTVADKHFSFDVGTEGKCVRVVCQHDFFQTAICCYQ